MAHLNSCFRFEAQYLLVDGLGAVQKPEATDAPIRPLHSVGPLFVTYRHSGFREQRIEI